ncbi:hypothetical protein RHMOL_Rhmol01G0157100 [Rhododendron molle]|uniref:Uncharacterized protein n=1 Tax=Rhododendron molle TaxID=49168 RepID=A0ACC0Q1S0_RHOML|nr:hypothetical protein RHMOL_Rhmol01G0157100 [Rhododendron molle]
MWVFTRYRVVSASSSSGSIQSSGRKKSRGISHSIQDQQGFKPPSHTETLRVLLKRQIVCHRCGQPGQIRSQCQRGQKSCFTCGEFDHVVRNYPQKKRMQEELGLV